MQKNYYICELQKEIKLRKEKTQRKLIQEEVMYRNVWYTNQNISYYFILNIEFPVETTSTGVLALLNLKSN